jgi:hypothetical protein
LSWSCSGQRSLDKNDEGCGRARELGQVKKIIANLEVAARKRLRCEPAGIGQVDTLLQDGVKFNSGSWAIAFWGTIHGLGKAMGSVRAGPSGLWCEIVQGRHCWVANPRGVIGTPALKEFGRDSRRGMFCEGDAPVLLDRRGEG